MKHCMVKNVEPHYNGRSFARKKIYGADLIREIEEKDKVIRDCLKFEEKIY